MMVVIGSWIPRRPMGNAACPQHIGKKTGVIAGGWVEVYTSIYIHELGRECR
jgi:hypothetical protein